MISTHIPLSDLLSNLTPDELQVLNRRAQILARPLAMDKEAQTEQIQVLTLSLEGEFYGLPVHYVREIRPIKRVTRVPSTPEFVVGVANLRGNILSLVHLRRFLGLYSASTTATLRMVVVVQAGGLELGLAVEHIGEVLHLNRDQFISTLATASGADSHFIQGVSPDGLMLLDLEALFQDSRMIIRQDSI